LGNSPNGEALPTSEIIRESKIWIVNKTITSEIVVAYAQCPRKAYLLLCSNETGRVKEYIAILERKKSIDQNSYLDNLRQQYSVMPTCNGSELRNGSSFLISGILQDRDCEADYAILTKVVSPSLLGEHSYEPTIFVGTHQVDRDRKLELIFVGYVLGQIQGQPPAIGRIIDAGLKSHTVSLDNGYKILTPILKDLRELIQSNSAKPPSLVLNKHCSYCQFQHLCQTQAEKDDNLSLLSHATAKVLKHYEKKGIFTVKQLSYLYKPRRRNKRAKKAPLRLHNLELQALAIRTNKIYLDELPQLTRKPIELFLDIEGIPDEQYEYLIGLLVCDETNSCNHYSFWADAREDEAKIWQQFTEMVSQYTDAPIYHYGDYEVRAISKLTKRYESEIDLDAIKKRLVNINTYIYGQVYFPVYSNGLKSIGKFIGATWTSPEASGLQSIVWRYQWENMQDAKYKDLLLVYNQEDCQALKLLTDKLAEIKDSADTLSDVDFTHQPKELATAIGSELHHKFDTILKIAHADHNKNKISLRQDKTKANDEHKAKIGAPKGHPGHTKLRPKTNKVISVATRSECPEHTGEALIESERITECIIINLILVKNGVKKTVVKYIGKKGFCEKCQRNYNPLELKTDYLAYGHGFQSWVVYHRLFLRLPYRVIAQTVADQFGEQISDGSMVNFIRYFSKFYTETEQLLTTNILQSPFIHADETKVNIQGVDQYVWVFTDGKYVVFKLTPTRESEIVHEFLGDYAGTLISDFYPGYDSVKCKQQKCWVHLIREMNDDLWKSPFDSEFEGFVLNVKNLIVPILEVVEDRGLKTKKLNKFNTNVTQFYENTINKTYKSDLALKYQKRFLRYRDSLFVFLSEDNIPWNNNAGERAIRHLAVQRKISGSFFESMMPHYLLLLGIMQTCRFQGKSFLKFLLSKEKDIDRFKQKKS
jgi:predicted RecB family nuclease